MTISALRRSEPRFPRRRKAPGMRLLDAREPRSDAGLAEGRDTPLTGTRAQLGLVRNTCPVLVAGSDRGRRSAVLDELAQRLPASTTFEEAAEFSQVLERAPSSRMVVFSGAIGDVPAASLIHTLGRRHPGLPIISLGAGAPVESPSPRA
ncbi:MAG: hypothetical protein ABSG95_04755 [Solirubrobacteraceae bacterium]|jgi:hypothetical protein